jgi:Tol biopolymer transport system component
MKSGLKWVTAITVALLFTATAHARTFEMVSLTNAGVPPSGTPAGTSHQAAVTPDGRYVVFEGSYTGLVASPAVINNNSQIYLRDRVAGTTELISQSTAGIPANNNNASRPSISNDGCRVVFVSYATNLIDGNTTSSSHIFLRNRCINGVVTPNKTTSMVDVMPNGSLATSQAFAARISGDGRTVVLNTYSMLVDGLTNRGLTCAGNSIVYLRHLESGTTTALTRPDGGCISGDEPDVSYNGTRIAFWSYEDLLNKHVGYWQIYVFDTSIGPTSLAVVSANANGALQLQDDGVHGGGGSTSQVYSPAISQDGCFVAFQSPGYGLWPIPSWSGISHIYVKDTCKGTIAIASVDSTGAILGNLDSGAGARPGLSSNGQFIVFRTSATNLVPETGGFVMHDNFGGATTGFTNTATNGYPDISPNGRYLTIYSGNYMDVRFNDRGMFLLDLGDPASPTRLLNLSTRGQVQTGNNVMIGGFIIGGSTAKKVLIRAVGPNLANYGVTGVLSNPTLELHKSSDNSIIASNDDWGTSANAAEITATALAPANSKEAAILATLEPGAYTAIVNGNGGGTGVGIVEVFELDHPEIPLINISTRGQVRTGNDVMIGGFIIQGSANQTVLIRAVGPNLVNYGVTGVLANPTLELHRSSDNSIIASNDNWGAASNAAAITATGLAPANALESAILISLPPGAYTAIVSGVGGGTGVGIVEVFAR